MWLFLIISFKGSTGRLRIVTLQSSDTPLKRVSAGSAMGGDAGTNCAALVRAKDKSAIPRASVLSDTNGRKFPYMILPQIGMLVERGDGEGRATRKCEVLFPGGLAFLILLYITLVTTYRLSPHRLRK